VTCRGDLPVALTHAEFSSPGVAITHRHEHLSWKCGCPRWRWGRMAPVPATPARCSSLAGKVRRVFWRMPETLVWMCP